jgi:hypothetical protein
MYFLIKFFLFHFLAKFRQLKKKKADCHEDQFGSLMMEAQNFHTKVYYTKGIPICTVAKLPIAH